MIRIFPSPLELAEKLAEEIVLMIDESEKRKIPFSLALSGGSTPKLLYSVLGDHFSHSVNWEYVHFFWGDERCVPPGSQESNYFMTRKTLLDKIDIPASNIHRIRGEDDPVKEAARYSEDISYTTRQRNGLPLIDLFILGLGEDGHTASIFAENRELLDSEKICEVAVHPVALQKRITVTGRIINNADLVCFLVTGRNKAEIVKNILNENQEICNLPASFIVPLYGEIRWFIDKDAAELL